MSCNDAQGYYSIQTKILNQWIEFVRFNHQDSVMGVFEAIRWHSNFRDSEWRVVRFDAMVVHAG